MKQRLCNFCWVHSRCKVPTHLTLLPFLPYTWRHSLGATHNTHIICQIVYHLLLNSCCMWGNKFTQHVSKAEAKSSNFWNLSRKVPKVGSFFFPKTKLFFANTKWVNQHAKLSFHKNCWARSVANANERWKQSKRAKHPPTATKLKGVCHFGPIRPPHLFNNFWASWWCWWLWWTIFKKPRDSFEVKENNQNILGRKMIILHPTTTKGRELNLWLLDTITNYSMGECGHFDWEPRNIDLANVITKENRIYSLC